LAVISNVANYYLVLAAEAVLERLLVSNNLFGEILEFCFTSSACNNGFDKRESRIYYRYDKSFRDNTRFVGFDHGILATIIQISGG